MKYWPVAMTAMAVVTFVNLIFDIVDGGPWTTRVALLAWVAIAAYFYSEATHGRVPR